MDWTHVLNWATYLVAGASAIANLTPTNSDNLVVNAISAVVHALALNWTGGAAKQ